MIKTFLTSFVLASASILSAAHAGDLSSAPEAELSEDQDQAEPRVTLTPEQEAAAASAVLPMIQLAPRNPEQVDRGTLCHSSFAQRSPICAQSQPH